MPHGDDDPVAHASTRLMMWASLAATAAEALQQVAAARSRERAALDEWTASQARAAHHARFARDRLWWNPPGGLDTADVRTAGLAWAASYAWRGTPEADVANDAALGRLRVLRPDVMRLYDFLTAEEGLDPALAMRRVAPLMDRPPAHPTRPDRLELVVPTGVADVAQEGFADRPQQEEIEVPKDVESARLYEVCAAAERFYASQVDGSWVGRYLTERGLTDCVEGSRWQVGYAAKEWTALVDHLGGLGFSSDEMVAAGLASMSSRGTPVDRFRDRLMVSVRDVEGRTVGFVGRANPYEPPNQRVPKYLNSPETALYRKGELLLGLWEYGDRLAAGARPVLVEGAFDAMAVEVASQGRWVGIAPSGTAVTSGQVETLRAANMMLDGLVVCLDGDQAGRQAAVRALDVLADVSPRAVVLPDGQDPAAMLQADRGGELVAALAVSRPLADLAVDAKIAGHADRLQWVEGRVNALRDAAQTVAKLPTRDIGHQVARLAKRLDMDVQTVTGVVVDQISKPPQPVEPAPRVGRRRDMARAR